MDKRNTDIALTQYLESKRAKPQFRPAPTAGMAVNRVMRPLSKGRGGGSSALALGKVWPDIMGPRWSKISSPVRFVGSKDGHTLIISAPGPAAALIMAASRPIIERLNAHLGEGHVTKLRVVQSKMTATQSAVPKRGLSPREAEQLQDSLSQVKQSGLKQALEKLGRGVMLDRKP
ncbi:DUF721 domain-containing protein [Litorimonas sp. RW-G-Af-16]|uniref:DUF721 domain-containing protein n=1 Tax=Litorimonas sp. RW-G-Af-16 TaxID=3241168 RepID=UPI003AAE5ED4